MFGQKFDSFNLSDMSEALRRNEALTDAEREDFFNALYGVQSDTYNTYQELMDIAIAADDPEMMQTVGSLADATLRQKGYTLGAYSDQMPYNADQIAQGVCDYVNQNVCSEEPCEPCEPEVKAISLDELPSSDVQANAVEPTELTFENIEDEQVLTPEQEFDALFDKLVPVDGNCETIGGELIRAAMKICYRYYNDGDQINDGYGKETCNAAARFLMAEASPEIKALIESVWNGASASKYVDFLTNLQSAVLAFIKANHLDTVSNYKNLDYLNYGTDEDVDIEYDDDDEYEDDEYDESKHRPYIAKEEDDFGGDIAMGSDSGDIGSDADLGADMGSDSSMDMGGDIPMDEEAIGDLIDDKEVHEILPEEDAVVVDAENPEEKGKVLNVHDDQTIDVKWDDGDVTRNTPVEDVKTAALPESFKVYAVKDGQLQEIYESTDPTKAVAMYNYYKSKQPTAECFYVKPSDDTTELFKRFNAEPINEEEDQQSSILSQIKDNLGKLYKSSITDEGDLELVDKKDNKCIVTLNDEEGPIELAIQVEMADGDTSEIINYIYNGIAPTADFIVASFQGEIRARSVESLKTKKTENLQEPMSEVFYVKRADGDFICDFYSADHEFTTGWETPLETGNFPIKHKFGSKDAAQVCLNDLNKIRIKAGLEPDDAEIIEVLPPKSECGTVADLGVAPILPASNGKGLAQAVVQKFDDTETKRLMDMLSKNESLETETDKVALAQELKQVQAATGQDLITIVDFLSEAEFRNISQVFGTVDSEEIANEIEAMESKSESKNEANTVLGFVEDQPVTALDDKAQFTAQQAKELSKMNPVNNTIQVDLTYRNKPFKPLADVEPSEEKHAGFIPLEPTESDLNQEVFASAVVAVSDAVKLADNIEAYTKLKELYPTVESKTLATSLMSAKESGKYDDLVKLLYDAKLADMPTVELSAKDQAKMIVSGEFGKDAWLSVESMIDEFDMSNANHRMQFFEQARMVIPEDAVRKVIECFPLREDAFINPVLNDAGNDINKRADGKPLATTNATGHDPVTPTLADAIDPADIVSPLPADQSEIDAITGKDPNKNEPDFNMPQQ